MLRKDELFVIESINNYYDGNWNEGEDPPDAYLKIGDNRISIEISILTQHIINDENDFIPRLSQDITAIRISNELNDELENIIGKDRKITLTLIAPINKARKFKELLRAKIIELLDNHRNEEIDVTEYILLNKVKIHIISSINNMGKKIFGIIGNSETSADISKNVRLILDNRIAIKNKKCKKIHSKGEVWLALFNDYWLASIDDYKSALAESTVTHDFFKIIIISNDKSVSVLYER